MKQFDVVLRPPAFLWDPYLTFDPDLHDLWPSYLSLFSSTTLIQQVCKTCFFLHGDHDLWPLTHVKYTMQNAWKSRFLTHKSPPCMSTGGLKNMVTDVWYMVSSCFLSHIGWAMVVVSPICKQNQNTRNSPNSPDMSAEFWKCPAKEFDLAGQNVQRKIWYSPDISQWNVWREFQMSGKAQMNFAYSDKMKQLDVDVSPPACLMNLN